MKSVWYVDQESNLSTALKIVRFPNELCNKGRETGWAKTEIMSPLNETTLIV